MTENFRFTSEDNPEKIRLNQSVEGLGLRDIQVQDAEDESNNSGYGEVQLQKITHASPPLNTQYRNDRAEVEPDDVAFGLDYLTNPGNTFTNAQVEANNKPVDLEGNPEPISSYLPNLDTLINNRDDKGKNSDKESERSYGRRSDSSHSSYKSRHSAKSSGGKSGGWRNGDFRTNKEAEYERKGMILSALAKLERKGVPMSRRFTMSSDLDDMEREYYRLKAEVDVENATMMMRDWLLSGLNILEWLNEEYDPFNFYMTGFTDHTFQSINRFDSVFEELYHKYHNRVNAPPEIRLVVMLGTSALAFHMTHQMTQDEKAMKELRSNPELMAKIREMTGQNSADNDEVEQRKKQYEQAQPAPAEAKDGFGREFINPEVNRGQGAPPPPPPSKVRKVNHGEAPQQQRQMRGPQGGNVEEVMRRMKEREAAAAAETKSNISDDSEKSESRTVQISGSRRGAKRPDRRSMKI